MICHYGLLNCKLTEQWTDCSATFLAGAVFCKFDRANVNTYVSSDFCVHCFVLQILFLLFWQAIAIVLFAYLQVSLCVHISLLCNVGVLWLLINVCCIVGIV